MARWAMVIDLDRCTACQACVVACQVENNVPPTGVGEAEKGRAISWLRVVPFVDEEAHGTRPPLRLTPLPCQHCDNPPCTKVCPVQATSIDDEGLVAQIYPRCIGCRYCANACPYTVKYFNWYPPEWPASELLHLNPDVSVRPKGVIEKCTFCHHRLQRAREQTRVEQRELREEDYQPACADVCPTRAIMFGDLDNPTHEVAELKENARAMRIMEDLGTQPKVYYLRRRS